MILEKLWRTLKAQANKVANLLWTADPIGQMQYEYDLAVEQLKSGREGLEQYRALIERVGRQVATERKRARELEAKVAAYLQAGDRNTAGQLALEFERVRQAIADNEDQLEMQEQAYENNVAKVKHAAHKLRDVREQIARYKSELKMTRAEAEIAKLGSAFQFDVTTNFGQIEQIIQDKISLNRATARVAADLSDEGLIPIEREQAMEKVLAEQALLRFESQAHSDSAKTIITESREAPKALEHDKQS
jgi:phage shock protein A